MRLEFWCPAKPLNITQAWGIYNPAYLQFGFSRHNGTDIKVGSDKKLYWPVKNCRVYDTEWGDATGWRIKANSLDLYDFPDGKRAYVNIIMMHMDHKSPVPIGTILAVGDYVGVPDNTGFSTGPHTHVMGRRVDANGNLIDKNDADNSFDLFEYWNKFYAVDSKTVIGLLQQVIAVLKAYLSKK
jgi:murein DD-endopeptidase MepM/ murein hydrolase activator NlpD